MLPWNILHSNRHRIHSTMPMTMLTFLMIDHNNIDSFLFSFSSFILSWYVYKKEKCFEILSCIMEMYRVFIKTQRKIEVRKTNSIDDFLQNADPPTLLHNSLRSNSARVGCDFAKNPMEFLNVINLRKKISNSF